MSNHTENRIRAEFLELKERGHIKDLPDYERGQYVKWHRDAYKNDILTTKILEKESPRWTIIAGYYAMHDVTKLYLAKKHGIKFSSEHVHHSAVVALGYALQDPKERDRALGLLEEAQEVYNWQENPYKEKILPAMLKDGRDQRGKAQYYTSSHDQAYANRAQNFLKDPVEPYMTLMKKMLGEEKDAD